MNVSMDLDGPWKFSLPDGTTGTAVLPGTLDENGIGGPDRPEKQWHNEVKEGRAEDDFFGENPIHTRFTRRHTYTGPACFERQLLLDGEIEGRAVVTVERARQLRLYVNGTEAEEILPGTLNTPWRFETGALRGGENTLRFVSDNSYAGWPADAILYSSAATDETQTNWNGLLGRISLTSMPPVFLAEARMICRNLPEQADLETDISVPESWNGAEIRVRILCEALREGETSFDGKLRAGLETVKKAGLTLCPGLRRWDPEDPYLYDLTVEIDVSASDGRTCRDIWRGKAGFRSFQADDRMRLCINGQRFFLRGETNCAAFPENGHPPMDEPAWEELIRQYQAYGVNCLRFHSHCPPEAAFDAADRLGMLMQPELSQWDPQHALESEESFRYYRTELRETLRMLGKHPSFVMMTLGNELACGETGRERMAELVREARALLPDRLYAWGSNAFYGARGCDRESDFYTAQKWGTRRMRAIGAAIDAEHPERKARIKGYLNNDYPRAGTNYSEGMAELRKQCDRPMFSFEVGQYQVLPDFHELEMFRGVTDPVNYRLIRRRAELRGLMPLWDRMVEASGELALIGYREETEAVMRTPEMSGLSLLALQDFPGQGTALVGMMNAHLRPKAYSFARPERFSSFFRDSIPLVETEKYTWRAGETLRADLRAVNYGRTALRGTLKIALQAGEIILGQQQVPDFRARPGESEIVYHAEMKIPPIRTAVQASIDVGLAEDPQRFSSRTRIWIYPEEEPETETGLLCTERLTGEVLNRLEAGASVLLEPPSEERYFPGGIRGQFTTDFWSTGTFPQQEGGMGLLIAEDHPVFSGFPTSFHTDYQWWLMAGQRAMKLPDERLAKGMIVRQMDSFSQLRSFAMLLEVRVGKGRLMISSMGLKQLPAKPEVTALRNAMLRYMKSEAFQPECALTVAELKRLLPGCV